MYKKILLTACVAVLLSGCLGKKARPIRYYEMTYKGEVCDNKLKNSKRIYVANIQALNLADSRNILIVDGKNNIIYVDDAKYITTPSEMVYKGIVSAVSSECSFEQIFRPTKDALVLNTSLLSLQINFDQAEVILGYELVKNSEILKSGVIKNHTFVPDPSTDTILKYMDISVNEALNKLIKEIK